MQRQKISTVLALIAILLFLPGAAPIASAARGLAPGGTSWAPVGILQVKGKGEKVESSLAVKSFFGPQTVTTDSGHIPLAEGEFLLALPRPGKDALLLGTYETNRKGKPKKFGSSPNRVGSLG